MGRKHHRKNTIGHKHHHKDGTPFQAMLAKQFAKAPKLTEAQGRAVTPPTQPCVAPPQKGNR